MKTFTSSFLTLLLRVVITHHWDHQCSCFVFPPTTTITKYYHTSKKCFEKDNDNPIQIYDNAFSSFACEELNYLADDHSSRGNDGSSVFTRPLFYKNNSHEDDDGDDDENENKKYTSVTLTPIEHAIDSFLTSIGDTTSKVEYWSRDEYINIHAHADIDEEQLEDTNSIRCPQMGHVLYLQVKDELRGPTCVFPTKRKGWSYEQKQHDDDDSNGENQHEIVDLVVIPAIEGRVLRFPGNAMHSVPCPANKWLSFGNNGNVEKEERREINDHNQKELEEFEEFDELGDEFDDEYDEYDDEIDRSVLLFNTWPDHEPGPKGVNGDYMTGSLPEGIELSEEDALSFFQTEEAQRLSEWEEEYGVNAEKLQCNDINKWREIEIKNLRNENLNIEKHGEIRIGLMGNTNRRLHENKFVTLFGSTDILEKALTSESQPTSIKLYGKQ